MQQYTVFAVALLAGLSFVTSSCSDSGGENDVPIILIPDSGPDTPEGDGGADTDPTPDEGTPDEGTPDEGTPDEGPPDEGTPDEGTPDDGPDTPDEGDIACPDPPPNSCQDDGLKRCKPGPGEIIEICSFDEDGCLVWMEDETCPSNNLCTNLPDVCDNGECVAPEGVDPHADCPPPDEACNAFFCNPDTGECEEGPANDETPCNDNDVCTDDDVCFDGKCAGTVACPKQCLVGGELDFLECGDWVDVALPNQGTNVMDGYGCEGAEMSYDGFEKTFALNPIGACPATLTLELHDPDAAGAEFVDMMLLSTDQGLCWPQDCVAQGEMDNDGRMSLQVDLDPAVEMVAVVDGLDGYGGTARLTLTCCNFEVEAYCGNGEDDDSDGTTDCLDEDCEGSPWCTFEYNCSDGVDNDGNGQTDCEDLLCLGLPECFAEDVCDDNIDNDEDGATDCDDEDCAEFSGCASQCQEFTALTCGQTLTDLTLDDVTTSEVETFSCGAGGGLTYDYGQVMLLAQPDCEGQYAITITPTGNPDETSWYDFFAIGPDCDGNQCVGEQLAWGEPASLSFLTTQQTHVWIAVMEAYGLGAVTGTFSAEMTCTCQ